MRSAAAADPHPRDAVDRSDWHGSGAAIERKTRKNPDGRTFEQTHVVVPGGDRRWSATDAATLDTLGPAHAEVIRLAQEGLTQAQIAERVGVPLGPVKTRTFHGTRALRNALIERGFNAI